MRARPVLLGVLLALSTVFGAAAQAELVPNAVVKRLQTRFDYRRFDWRHPFQGCAAIVLRYGEVPSTHGFETTWMAATILYLRVDGSFSGQAAEYAMPRTLEPFNARPRSSQTREGATSVVLSANEGFRYDTGALGQEFAQTGQDAPPKEDHTISVISNWRQARSNLGDVATICAGGPRRGACHCVANFAK